MNIAPITQRDIYQEVIRLVIAEKFDEFKKYIESKRPHTTKIEDARYRDGTTALMIACQMGNAKFVNYLLDNGSSVTRVNRFLNDSLMYAAYSGKKDIVEKLIHYKADATFVNRGHVSALIVAAERGHDKIVSLLLASRADPFQETKRGENALICAAYGKHRDVVPIVLAAMNDGRRTLNKELLAPLLCASESGSIPIIETLISYKGDVNCQDLRSGHTPLSIAAAHGNERVVRRLLELKASPQIVDYSERTPLMCAALRGDVNIITLLLSNNADPNQTDENGNNALMYAVAKGNKSAVYTLVRTTNLLHSNKINETAADIAKATRRFDIETNLFHAVKRFGKTKKK